MDAISKRIIEGSPTVEQEAEAAAKDKERKAREEIGRRAKLWMELSSRIGRRYANCTLANFAVDGGSESAKALGTVWDFVAGITDNLDAGRNAMFYGPPGTGKDHLAVAIMRTAVLEAGATCEWVDGAEFYGMVRDRIGTNGDESSFLKRFTKTQLLVMSDPVPPIGDVRSEYQLSMLFRVLDRRYRDQRSTIVTLNVADRAEAEKRLSPNLIDRLAHGALAVHCNWTSWRRK